jgi:UDP-N-acetylmuramoylalanine--D-glutamate ligase
MQWEGKRVVILGAARQGTALAAYLASHGARVTLNDRRPAEQLVDAQARLAGIKIDWHFGEPEKTLLRGAKLVCLSGGVSPFLPIVQEAVSRSIPISNDSQIFLELAPCPTVGITGSAGKTTTTILVARMLKRMEGKGFRTVWLGGNIGNPLIAAVDEMRKDDLAVMELSSFQLELMSRSPHIAVLLNLAPNHLDRHATMADYAAAKARILDFQAEADIAVLDREDVGAWALRSRVKGQLWSFGREEIAAGNLGSFVRGNEICLRDARGVRRLFPVSAIELRGEHNLRNVLAACAIAAAAGASDEAMLKGVEGFTGAPHRLEWVANVDGVDWYNDSIATAPQRAEASLRSFNRRVVLLLGGRDKDLHWESLAKLANERTRRVLAFGEAAPMIQQVFETHAKEVKLSTHESMAAAVAEAAKVAKSGEVVLLAPGGTSFDEFVDFEARGEEFRKLVSEL